VNKHRLRYLSVTRTCFRFIEVYFRKVQRVRHKRKSSRRWQKKWLKRFGHRTVRNEVPLPEFVKPSTPIYYVDVILDARIRNNAVRVPIVPRMSVYDSAPRDAVIAPGSVEYKFQPVKMVTRMSQEVYESGNLEQCLTPLRDVFWRDAERLINVMTEVKKAP